MSKFGSNPFVKLTDLLATPGPQIVSVSTVHTDGTVTIARRGGGSARVRSNQALSPGDQVIIEAGAVTGKAPVLSSSSINI